MAYPQYRRIIHVDMDAFFASVEQRDFPNYQGKPVVVGGEPDSRGVVAACSYEARKFGVRSAMSCAQAYRLCPDARFVRPRFEVYKEVSHAIRAIFKQYTHLIEPLSLDEAYLDVSNSYRTYGSATAMATAIRQHIHDTLNLNASAGISYNKFLAKIASDVNKPNGQFVVKPPQAKSFIASLPIGRFFGIGRVTEQKMKRHGIHTGSDLQKKSLTELTEYFGNSGSHFYDLARGIDERAVSNERKRKSIGKETTFSEDLTEMAAIVAHLHTLSDRVYQTIETHSLLAKTATIKVRYNDFTTVTRSQSLVDGYTAAQELKQIADQLLEKTECGFRPIRLLGVSVSNFIEPESENTTSISKPPNRKINQDKRQIDLF